MKKFNICYNRCFNNTMAIRVHVAHKLMILGVYDAIIMNLKRSLHNPEFRVDTKQPLSKYDYLSEIRECESTAEIIRYFFRWHDALEGREFWLKIYLDCNE